MKKFVLIAIVAVAFFLRIYKVTEIPPSLSWDEVSIGYNAYSILKTGKDEHGKFLPLDTFAAFGDYKPPVAIYLTVPSIALFGLNEFAVRFPSVLAGTLTILFTIFLVKELFRASAFCEQLALLSGVLLAISPWHLNLSRAGFEANIATFFVVVGMYCVIRAMRSPKYFFWCWVPFVFGIYTFNSTRYFVPVIGVVICLLYKKEILGQWKKFLIGMVIAGVLLLPILPHLFSKEARLRYEEVNIFSDIGIVEKSNARISYEAGRPWASILNNRRVGFVRSYLIHFFDHFQPWFLFIRGDGNPKFSIQDVGQLYLIEAPFLLLGILALFRDARKQSLLLSLWLVAAILPAAVARETPHALRIENSLPTWQVFVAYGIWMFFSNHHRINKLRKIFVVGLYMSSFGYYWHNYYHHYPREYSGEWQYGYREAIQYIQPVKKNYDRIIVSESIGRPYAYVLFYEQYDPDAFRKTVRASYDAAGFYNVSGFDRYEFVRRLSIAGRDEHVLYVMPPDDVPNNAHILTTVRLLNGEPSLVVFD